MWNRRRCRLFALLAAVSISAGSVRTTTTDDLIRQANDACEQGRWDDAEALYTQAEERTSDPGLVSFNKGIALWRRGEFRRAELGFRRCLGDAAVPAERRAKALYNLGNCLVKQAGDSDLKRLQAAIDCYELVLRETAEDGLRLDAGHNMEVAKQLWAKARAKRPPKETDPEWEEPKDPKNPPPDPRKNAEDDPSKLEPGKTPEHGKKLEPGKGNEQGPTPKEVEKPAPGKGDIPVIPDTDDVKPVPRDDALLLLQKTGERLQKERQKLRQEALQGDRPRANDW